MARAPARAARVICLIVYFFVSAFSSILSKNRAGWGIAAVSRLVENVGLEPTTPGLQSRCSSQLSQSPR